MKSVTIYRAYRAARARANWNVHDREAYRQQRVFETRLERILTEYDEARDAARTAMAAHPTLFDRTGGFLSADGRDTDAVLAALNDDPDDERVMS